MSKAEVEREGGLGVNTQAFQVAQWVKNLPGGKKKKNLSGMQETWVWFLGQEDPLEQGMAIHSRILAWRIPWTQELVGLQSRGLQRVGHD